MMRLFPFLGLLGCLLTAPAIQAGEDILPEYSGDIDRDFVRILDEAGVPGGAFVVVRGDRIAHASSHGVRTQGQPDPVTVETVFRLASVSKTFAAQLTALLVEEQLLDWDQRVVEHVPELRFASPEHAGQLRIRHLLGQSTGIVPNAYDNLLNASQNLDQILPRFAEVEPMCSPGRCYTYQNVLFALVGPAVERATGIDYDTLVARRLLQPLGMRHASVGMLGYQGASDQASPHVRARGAWWPTEVNENYYRVAPAAGVNASALDLGQWLIAQLGHRPDVIPPATLAAVTEPQVRTTRDLRRRGWRNLLSDAHYGLGWRIYQAGDDTIYLHSGWVRGFVAEVAYSRERQIGLGVLLNAESSALNEFTTTFWADVLSGESMVRWAVEEGGETDSTRGASDQSTLSAPH